jgi:exosortase A-associated hydrolase 1
MEAESAVTFECQGETLLGVLHRGHETDRAIGILIVVGGPQYRVGSHRQFVLMARAWAQQGYAVLRFDHRGVGDSAAAAPGFEAIQPDIRAALDAFFRSVPSLQGAVIFGLCDAASAALLYCREDARLRGLVLANPWVRTTAGEARSQVRHYYGARLLQREFWNKLFGGGIRAGRAVRGFLDAIARARGADVQAARAGTFISRMREGLQEFKAPVLVLISGQDLTAAEFTDLCGSDPDWQAAITRASVQLRRLPHADHTFSTAGSLETACAEVTRWLAGLERSAARGRSQEPRA